VPAIVVKPRGVADAYNLRAKYRGHGTVALFPAEVLLPLYALLGNVHALLEAMSIAFEILIIASVLLVIVAVLAGRRQGIAVLRALGAPRRFVFSAIWLEGATLIGLGTAVGGIVAMAFMLGVGAYATARTGVAIHPKIGSRELAILAALFVSGSLLAALPSLAAISGEIGPHLRRAPG